MDGALPNDISSLQSLVLSLQSENEHLKLLVEKFRRMLFGKSAERFAGQIEQFELALDEKAQDVAQVEAELAARQSVPSRQQGRRALPEHRPREIIEHLPQATRCPDCGGALKHLGEDVSEVLDYVPASFRVQRHVLSAGKIHGDDTPVPVLAPGMGQTKTGRLWVYVRDDRPAGDATPPAPTRPTARASIRRHI